MINIHTQTFYNRSTGAKHVVAINFGWISKASNGHYEVLVDGEIHSKVKSKGKAFDEVVRIIKDNNYSAINQMVEG